MTFKDRLTMLRMERNWTKKETAEKIGLSTGAYANYEYGNREPNQEILSKIAKVFNVSVEYLVSGNLVLKDSDNFFFLDKEGTEKLNEVKKAFLSNFVISDELRKAAQEAHNFGLPLLTKDINFESNKNSESLQDRIEVIDNFFYRLQKKDAKINYLELEFLVESFSMIEEIRSSNISDEQQYYIYNSLTETIKEIRNNLNTKN